MNEHHPAPEWSISETLNASEPFSLKGERGRVIVACAFQMLCPGCVQRAIPQLKAVYELFSRSGVSVAGLHTVFEHHDAMTPVSLRAFLLEYQVRFPVCVDAPADDGGATPLTMRAYEMQGTPTLLLIDRAGRLRRQIFGSISDLELGAEIAGLIAEAE